MLTIGLVAVLARSRTVQTYAAQQAAQWLSKELKADVRIRALEFDFFTNIINIIRLYIQKVFRGGRCSFFILFFCVFYFS